jgi:1-deoxy-D-xylulose-5-phosphate reductoisomerase
VLNAANEVAVERFLERGMRFMDIPHLIESVLGSVNAPLAQGVEDVLALDHEARSAAWDWSSSSRQGTQAAAWRSASP